MSRVKVAGSDKLLRCVYTPLRFKRGVVWPEKLPLAVPNSSRGPGGDLVALAALTICVAVVRRPLNKTPYFHSKVRTSDALTRPSGAPSQ